MLAPESCTKTEGEAYFSFVPASFDDPHAAPHVGDQPLRRVRHDWGVCGIVGQWMLFAALRFIIGVGLTAAVVPALTIVVELSGWRGWPTRFRLWALRPRMPPRANRSRVGSHARAGWRIGIASHKTAISMRWSKLLCSCELWRSR
jgi:hypothetical protein